MLLKVKALSSRQTLFKVESPMRSSATVTINTEGF